MKGRDFLNTYLNSEEIDRWERNTGTNGELHGLNSDYNSLWDFIGSSFVWSHTNEGFEYWCEISERKGLVKKNIPKFIL